MSDWSNIGPDILPLIITHLTSISDHITISSVCRSWRSIATLLRCTLPHPIPALMVVTSPAQIHRQFLFFPHKNSEYHNLEWVSTQDQCCGSHRGWLFLIEKHSYAMYVVNPFIGERIFLPKLDGILVKNVHKAVLSSSPSDDSECVVLILCRVCVAAFCKLGDESWTVLCEYGAGFSDALFFGDGFYVVDDYGNIFACNFEDPVLEEVFSQAPKNTHKWYLVELKGEMYRIQRVSSSNLGFYDEEMPNVEDDCGFMKLGSLVSTKEFRVSKLDRNKNGWKWAQVRNLGEYALFLGGSNSVALSELEVSGIKGNRIYFTDDRDRIKHFGFIWPGKDMGVFDLGDSSVEPLCWTQCEWLNNPRAVWVAPIPW